MAWEPVADLKGPPGEGVPGPNEDFASLPALLRYYPPEDEQPHNVGWQPLVHFPFVKTAHASQVRPLSDDGEPVLWWGFGACEGHQINDLRVLLGQLTISNGTAFNPIGPPVGTPQPIRTTTSSSVTVAAADAGGLITADSSSPITLTVPAEVLTAGQRVDVLVLGTGAVTVVGSGGMTIDGTPSLVSRARYSALSILALADDRAVVVGDLESP